MIAQIAKDCCVADEEENLVYDYMFIRCLVGFFFSYIVAVIFNGGGISMK
jgi:hypothetical protein